ncbi:MAG: hypothetical protein Fur0032_17370 [Terrimicrobiaceae bacterium]
MIRAAMALLTGALLVMAPARAADQVWAALALATNEEPPGPVPKALENFQPALARVFGYNTFYLLGQKRAALETGDSGWLVPSPRIFMQVTGLGSSRSRLHLRLDLYEGKELLATTEARLARGAPLYIRGPEWGKGLLIIVLEIR